MLPRQVKTRMHWDTQRTGVRSRVLGVRYWKEGIWANSFLKGRVLTESLTRRVANLVDLASINWFHSNPSEQVPSEAFQGLSPRQRSSQFLLMDVLSRKQIASRLGLTEHAVGDHMKALYQRFRVIRRLSWPLASQK
jgi:DNA-binding CsgD family transcriptional regulator